MATRQSKRRKQRKKTYSAKSSLHKNEWWKERKNWYIIGSILLLAFAVFSPSFNNEFLNWDDDLYVTENETIQAPFDNWGEIWDINRQLVGNYHPMTELSLAFNYAISGYEISSYHWTNILLHLMNTFLVFAFIMQVTRGKLWVAGVTAALFGLHPMHVESVTWIAERKDVLYTFFFLSGLMAFVRYIRTGKGVFYAAALALFVFSCLSKPAAVVFPMVLLALEFFLRKKYTPILLVDKIPFFVISIAFGLLTLKAQESANAVGDMAAFSFLQRIYFASYGFIMYIVKFLVPVKLSAFYPYPHPVTDIPPFFMVAPLIVLAIVLLALYSLKKTKIIAFGMLFYAFTVALVLQFISVGDAILADRYTYVPYIGLAFIVGWGFHRLFQLPKARYQNLQYAALSGLGIVLLIFSYSTYQRTQIWKDPVTMWTDVVTKYPASKVAWNNRGHHFRQISEEAGPEQKQELLMKALDDYNKALSYDPKYGLSWSNKGKVYFELNLYEQSIESYNKALEYNPDRAIDYVNRGAALTLTGEVEKGLEDFNKAISLDADIIQGYQNRGITYDQLGQLDKAIADYNEVLRLDPGFHGIYNNRALAYQKKGNLNQAIQDFTTAIQLNPNEGIYYQNRALAYANNNQKTQAAQDVQRAQQLGIQFDQSFLSRLK